MAIYFCITNLQAVNTNTKTPVYQSAIFYTRLDMNIITALGFRLFGKTI